MTLDVPSRPLVRPDPFTTAELEGAKVLRASLPKDLPADLCTDFALARLWRAHRGNCAEAERCLRDLAAHMRAFDYDLDKSLERCLRLDFAAKVFERFAISRLDHDIFSGDMLVFLQRMEGVDIKQILRVLSLGQILQTYTLLQMNLMRAIHDHERSTGRPAAVTIVIDLRGLPFRDFINPLSACSKMARHIVRIWSEYFSEHLVRLYLVHPPALISIMWQIIKHIADQKTQARIMFVPKGSDLVEHLGKEAVPEAYGGLLRDDSGFSSPASSCVSRPLPVRANDHFSAKKWWAQNTIPNGPMPEFTELQLKGKMVHETPKIKCLPGDRFLWLYTANGDLHFEVVCQTDLGEEIPVWPKALVTSLNIPENGSVVCAKGGVYFARFTGIVGHFEWLGASGNTKISYIVHRVAEGQKEMTAKMI